MTLRYDYEFDAEATNNTAAAVFRYAAKHGPRVLDIGSGPAVVSSRLVRDLDFDVTCIDFDADAIAAAKERGVKRTFVRDLTGPDWAEDVVGEKFNLIVLADVLEHLPNPQDILATIRELELLAPGGRIVLSMPNASHEMVIASLLVDDFRYTDVGILDNTHIRWFTMKSMQRLLQSESFSIESSVTITRTLDQTSHKSLRIDLDPALRRSIVQQVPNIGVYQYVFGVAPLEESSAALVARDDVVVREASALADVFVKELAERRDELAAQLADRDKRIAELTTLLNEARQHAMTELERAAKQQSEFAATQKKNAATIARQNRELSILGPYLRLRRLVGRAKRVLSRALR